MNMDEQIPKKRRCCKTFCVAGGPNNKSCTNSGDTPGVTMHRFPNDQAVRQQWVQFVRRHQVDFDLAKYSSRIHLCSAHFKENCYSKRFATTLEGFDNGGTNRFLIKGSIPTIDVNIAVDKSKNENISAREKRTVCI